MVCGYQVHLKHASREMYVPCGQCMNCRINRKRLWTGRILLEARYQPRASSFVTLTYDEGNLPNRGSLEPRDLAGFIGRLRARRSIRTLGNPRFFAVGEYGDQTWRPHYHISLFGIQPEREQAIKDSWTLGHVHIGEITPESASYLAGYTTKKLTSSQDPRLQDLGLHPEFARMSRFPPLGAAGIKHSILPSLETRGGAIAIAERGDVPTAYTLHGKNWPIGSYWRKWLRDQLGITDPPPYEPWVFDPDQFQVFSRNAQKKADKAFNQARYKKRSAI